MQTQSKSLSQQRLLMSVGAAMECRIRNDRQSYFALARELAHAQFILSDSELSCRLGKMSPTGSWMYRGFFICSMAAGMLKTMKRCLKQTSSSCLSRWFDFRIQLD